MSTVAVVAGEWSIRGVHDRERQRDVPFSWLQEFGGLVWGSKVTLHQRCESPSEYWLAVGGSPDARIAASLCLPILPHRALRSRPKEKQFHGAIAVGRSRLPDRSAYQSCHLWRCRSNGRYAA